MVEGWVSNWEGRSTPSEFSLFQDLHMIPLNYYFGLERNKRATTLYGLFSFESGENVNRSRGGRFLWWMNGGKGQRTYMALYNQLHSGDKFIDFSNVSHTTGTLRLSGCYVRLGEMTDTAAGLERRDSPD